MNNTLFNMKWWVDLVLTTESFFNLPILEEKPMVKNKEVDLVKILGQESSLLTIFGEQNANTP